MRVHYDEGIATRIGPEPCAGARKGVGEASAGERIGQPSNHERKFILGADVVPYTGSNTDGGVNASPRATRRGLSVHPGTP